MTKLKGINNHVCSWKHGLLKKRDNQSSIKIAVLKTKVEQLSCGAELHIMMAPKKVNEMQHDREDNSSVKD